ncbi:MAG: lactate dehydrogenase [Armatimonadota bacterium]
MDVAILGASGDCGREIAAQLVSSRLLAPTERMQLVGRAGGASEQALYGFVTDLTDAHAEYVPDLDVALTPRDVVADLWVFAAGQTAPTKSGSVNRDDLALNNARIFAEYAEALATHGQGTEVVVIVSNPVELGVAIFARAIGRDRVIGIGAYQDTLRFRREIAWDLGVRRQRVGGFMIGEHGDGQAPIWSSVVVHGMEKKELERAVTRLRRGTEDLDFQHLIRESRETLSHLVAEGRIQEAFAYADTLPPDVRVVVKPFVTHLSGAKTVMATANVTVDLVQTLLDGREVLVAGQVALEPGEFYGLTGPLGVPVIASPSGIMRVVEIPLTRAEENQVRGLSTDITAKVTRWIETMEAEA